MLPANRSIPDSLVQAHFKLGRVFGIEIGFHYSWIVIAILITLSLAHHFAALHADWGNDVVWASATITGALFFAAIIIHELSHAMVARARNVPVRAIILFALGGIAHIEKESEDPKTEFWMGIVGPMTSAALGLLCLAGAWLLGRLAGGQDAPPAAMLTWLGYINLVLAAFNMIPGFPLDGGRVLRSLVWWATKDAARATSAAARVGQVIAYAFMAFGIFGFFFGSGIGSLWLALIGWFLLEAARASQAQVQLAEAVGGVRVADVMTRECETIDRHASVQVLVDDHLLRTGRRCFVVRDNSHVAGIVTPSEVKDTPRHEWASRPVEQIMRPLDRLRTVTPETSIAEALETMAKEDVNQLPVVSSGGQLEGVISRANIIQLLQSRRELKA